MGYWYCKAEVVDTKEVQVTEKNWLGIGIVKTIEKASKRVVEGKVLSTGNSNEYNTSLLIVVREGINPEIVEISPYFNLEKPEENFDKILELRWVK